MVEKRKCQENHKEEKITYCIVKKKKSSLSAHPHSSNSNCPHQQKSSLFAGVKLGKFFLSLYIPCKISWCLLLSFKDIYNVHLNPQKQGKI